MKSLNDKDLIIVYGGAMNATMINAIGRILSTVIEVGRMVGTSIRRIAGGRKSWC